ncbi:hypothetical protein CUMW_079660 [Citrus unshiu]|uniref:Uncharacterized protein n=1 Tax=Citrus unshiu TaxID=55188 RepID=A0A2H5NVF7_CITUN|nr:hypothetical protein CUMW_079660 [Citrus unshiu]
MSAKRSSINRPPTPDVDRNRENQEPALQEIINIKMIESGEKERLKELLRERLIECASVPDPVKAELLQRIRSFLASTAT